ncbi:MAG: GNAT family N-acetyltransferase [Actinomycetota bacterium]|nr:GNAT family N-acetyltransferase [Actinomycetota bacterium]
MEIRVCATEDLDRLRAQWPTPGSDVHGAHFAAQQRGSASYLVAWRGTLPLGSARVNWAGCVGANARSAYPECVEIHHLQVRPGERGGGVGAALIGAAETLIRSHGHTHACLGVAADNPGAARLYRRLGYRSTGVRDLIAYTWIDENGVAHDKIEDDELRVKTIVAPDA